MPAPVENLTVFAVTTLAVLIFFVLIPGTIAVLAGFIIGIVASLPILAVASLTRLVSHEPLQETEEEEN